VPRSARELLSANVILSRRYHNPNTGQSVSLLLVHCKDARDIAGHYPPNCYPSQGWTQRNREDYTWGIAGDSVPVRSYLFTMERPTGDQKMRVLNTLLLPDGELTREMSVVRQAAADYQARFYGAGQLQVVVNSRMSPTRRQAIFERFYKAVHPALKAMRSGLENHE